MADGSPLPQQPVAGLAAQLAEVERQAGAAVAGLALPLLPPCLSRQEILKVLRTHRPVVGPGLEGRMAFLLLLTDLVAASLASPGLADLFLGASEKPRTALLDRLRQEWSRLFKDVPSAPWAPRPRPETARALRSGLARCLALLPPGQGLPAGEADTFLRSYGLPPLPGTTRSAAHSFTAPLTLHGFTAPPDKRPRLGAPSSWSALRPAASTNSAVEGLFRAPLLNRNPPEQTLGKKTFGKENKNHNEVTSIDPVDQLQEVYRSEVVPKSLESSNRTFSGRNLFGSPSTKFVFKQLNQKEAAGAKGREVKPGDPPVDPALGCNCDDCRFVTSPHVARMRVGRISCRCHPCVLARSQL